jgi:hypothetical protein
MLKIRPGRIQGSILLLWDLTDKVQTNAYWAAINPADGLLYTSTQAHSSNKLLTASSSMT